MSSKMNTRSSNATLPIAKKRRVGLAETVDLEDPAPAVQQAKPVASVELLDPDIPVVCVEPVGLVDALAYVKAAPQPSAEISHSVSVETVAESNGGVVQNILLPTSILPAVAHGQAAAVTDVVDSASRNTYIGDNVDNLKEDNDDEPPPLSAVVLTPEDDIIAPPPADIPGGPLVSASPSVSQANAEAQAQSRNLIQPLRAAVGVSGQWPITSASPVYAPPPAPAPTTSSPLTTTPFSPQGEGRALQRGNVPSVQHAVAAASVPTMPGTGHILPMPPPTAAQPLQSAVPGSNPVDTVVNTGLTHHPNVCGVEDVPNDVVERMRAISNYVYPSANTFSTSLVPVNSDWGRGKNEKYLLYNGSPAVVWLVGRVKSLWFYSRTGEPQSRVSIGVDLGVHGDLDAVRVLYGRARPRSTLTSDVVYASRFQSVRERGATSSQPVPFEEVYDATGTFSAKSSMPRLAAADIAEGDVVVVEANFTRWKKPTEAKKKIWSTWDVGFELLSVSLLYSDPTVGVYVPDVIVETPNVVFSL